MRLTAAAAMAALLVIGASAAAAQVPRSDVRIPVRKDAVADARALRLADSLLALMTLEEKLGQLTQAPNDWQQTGPTAHAGSEADIRAGRIGSYVSLTGAVATRAAQRVAVEQSRLRIPLLFGYDVIHGMRTIFPINLAIAGTFDSTAAVRMARISAREATASGIHWTFAPMVDVARDARWGRIVEGAGEDPYLGSVMAAAQVVGYQGNGTSDLRSPTTLLATVKHFAAYGGAEAGRDYNTVSVGERQLWESYMPPYEAAVRAGAGSVMASFNEIDGVPSHASDWLLGDVLRRRWGFRGFVVSDWTGVLEMIPHGLGDSLTVGSRSLRAGVDMEMSSALFRDVVGREARAGRFPLDVIDAAVHRVLVAKAMLGLFDDPYRGTSEERERTGVLTAADRRVARDIAREAIVLLTNDTVGGAPALPLRRDLRSLAVIGPLAADSVTPLGAWSAAGRPADVVTVLAGLQAALPGTRIEHAAGVAMDSTCAEGDGAAPGIDEAVRLAQGADAVLLVLGEHRDMSGEAASRSCVELPGAQRRLARAVIRAVRAATPDKPMIAVLVNGRPLAVPFLADSASALVESWQLGVEHGNALADVLVGEVAPSGRLPVTMPRSTGQLPIYYERRNTGRPAATTFPGTEKYTSRYLDVAWTPLFPFGHGLSYTTFAYANLRVARPAIGGRDSLVVTVDVTNTGARVATEVVQLYLRDDAASVTRPVRQLRGFRRVALAPGETRTVRFTLQPRDLAMYDRAMRHVVEPGTFTLWAGGSSAATLSAGFRVDGGLVVLERATPALR